MKGWLQVPAVALGVLALAAGCGSSAGTKAAPAAPPSAPSPGTSAGGGTGARPGTTGKISAVNPSSIFVQNTSSQVTVNFTDKTTFTQTLTVGASALKVGDCVTATDVSPAASARPGASPSTSRTPVSAITATAVTVTSTTGTCTLGTGLGRPNRTPGAFPSSRVRPSGAPGGFGGRGGFGGAAFGKVASLGSGTFVVTGTRAGKTSNTTVTTTSATTYRQAAAATMANLKVGLCATAIGTTDDTGAVTARTIALSTATANGCSQFGFGGGRFRSGTSGGSGAAG